MKTQILSVSQLTYAITRVLEEKFGKISVQGEISNFKLHSSGHRYFTLKDEGASISCVMWRSKSLNFQPADGMKVIVNGSLTVYPPRGNYQIDVTSIKPLGQGDLFLAYEALKEKLETKGYFRLERKKAITAIPTRIGVSTSPTGAAIRDILSTLERRAPFCTVYFRPTLVQGEDAALDIAEAIKELNEIDLDCIIIGRGGGSLEDLWAYNMEITADAIYNSGIPVVSAVGHETDFTIADFVADHRAPTPTGAAELVTPYTIDNLIDILLNAQNSLTHFMKTHIKDKTDYIDSIAQSYSFRSISDRIKNFLQLIDEYEYKIFRNTKNLIRYNVDKLNSLTNNCRSQHPYAPLKKGFAYLESEGRFITKNEKLGNFLNIDVVRATETANVTINNIKKKKNLLNIE
jgi:exodeoxyribonuclease VII large subunit